MRREAFLSFRHVSRNHWRRCGGGACHKVSQPSPTSCEGESNKNDDGRIGISKVCLLMLGCLGANTCKMVEVSRRRRKDSMGDRWIDGSREHTPNERTPNEHAPSEPAPNGPRRIVYFFPTHPVPTQPSPRLFALFSTSALPNPL